LSNDLSTSDPVGESASGTASNDSTSSPTARDTDGVVIREKKPPQGKGKKEAHLELQRDLTLRLNHLKAEAREACESYLANVDSDVSTLVEFLNGSSVVKKPRDRKAVTLKGWTKTLDGTQIKPHKGRVKDLRRIDRAIRSMMETAFE
jgi:hypothetical protein